MENKKLVTILLNDLTGMEELIVEMKKNHQYDPVDLEFLQTRAKGIRQMLEVLIHNIDHLKDTTISPVITEPISQPIPTVGLKEKEVKVIPQQEIVEKSEVKPPEVKKIEEKPVAVEAEVKHAMASDSTAGIKKEEPESEKQPSKEPKILGEKFAKEKSVNDLISDQSNLETKFTNRPISSISASIGINDRFLFIRELFAGNSDKFEEVVKNLDSLGSLQEAIDLLKAGFQWKDNETSQKFLNLVKRRYTNA